MSKGYDHQYFINCLDRRGDMICNKCRKEIGGVGKATDYRAYKKSKGFDDWYYVTHHRECCSDDPQWEVEEAKRRERQEREQNLNNDIKALIEKYGEDEVRNMLEDIING